MTDLKIGQLVILQCHSKNQYIAEITEIRPTTALLRLLKQNKIVDQSAACNVLPMPNYVLDESETATALTEYESAMFALSCLGKDF